MAGSDPKARPWISSAISRQHLEKLLPGKGFCVADPANRPYCGLYAPPTESPSSSSFPAASRPAVRSFSEERIPDDEPNLDWFNRPRNPSNPDPDGFDQRPGWQPAEIRLDDGRTLVLEEF